MIAMIALLVGRETAVAQRDQFFEAVLPFYRALTGAYGDEGTRLPVYLDALAASLRRWDRALAVTETKQRARLDAGDGQTRLEVHTTLASLYAERGQFARAL